MRKRSYPIFTQNDSLQNLGKLAAATLFYPCADQDIIAPVKLFAPYIRTFWFVDTGYFFDHDPNTTPPIFRNHPDFELIEASVYTADLSQEEWIQDKKYRGQPPYILAEKYQHLPSQTIVTINRHQRRGPSALRKEIDKLAIFFYRSDSDEGGSATYWLTAYPKMIQKGTALPLLIVDKLVDGGLIITDGSMCKISGNPYNFFLTRAVEFQKTSKLETQSFGDPFGNRFDFIGTAGIRHNRFSLIWKLTKA